MRCVSFVLVAALLASGCSEGQTGAPGSDATRGTSTEGVTATASDDAEQAGLDQETTTAAPGTSQGGREVKDSNDLYEFGYAYPDAAGAIPALKERLEGKLNDTRKKLIAESREDQKQAKSSGYPYRPHSSDTTWKVVADLPDWLSLSSQVYVYTGGAHGMTAYASLVWDKEAGVAREPVALFTSAAALRKTIQRPFCNALDREREKRRGAPVRHGADDMFSDCINPMESTLILGSSKDGTFNRLGVLVGPYAAGPYAEGTYEITLPITREVLGAVKPEYKEAFSTGG